MCSPMSAVAKDVGSDSSSSALLAGAAATDKTSINAECPDHIGLMGPGPMSMAGLDRAQSGSLRAVTRLMLNRVRQPSVFVLPWARTASHRQVPLPWRFELEADAQSHVA